MFDKWRESREAQRKREADIQADDYLRRLRNSASMLCGLSHSGNGDELDHTLSIGEVRSILRRSLEEQTELGERHG